MNWLDQAFPRGYIGIQINGTPMAPEQVLNFLTGATGADDAQNKRTNITITASGGTTPTGTGFTHITSGVQDSAARAVNLASTDVTGTLPLTSEASPTGSGFPHVTTGAWDAAARAVNLASSDVTGVLPAANLPVATTIAVGIIQLAGDLGGTDTSPSVLAVHGSSVPAGGALTTGNGLYASGASALSYSALNLAGGSGWVTGVLPAANQASQSLGGSLAGTTASATVSQVDGTSNNANVACYQTTWTSAGTAITVTPLANDVLSAHATATTTNTTSTTAPITIAAPAAGAYEVVAKIVAYNSAGTAVGDGSWTLRGVYKSSGTAWTTDVAAATLDSALSSGSTLPTPTITQSTNVVINVGGAGLGASTVKWHVFVQITGVG